MKLCAYVRVSTTKQASEGLGLAVQERAIRSWARAHGHRIAVWARDEGVSGANGIDTRVGLFEALGALSRHEVAGLIAYDLSRLARLLATQEAVLGRIWEAGGTMFTVEDGEVLEDDPDDPMRTALRQMRGVFSQLERATITKRMRSGRQLRRERGGYAGDGPPPLGFRSARASDGGKVLVPDDGEQATVARIAELHRQDKSLRVIAATLDAEGWPTKRGGKWAPQTLALILRRLDGRR